jgi:hypothetical protein
MRRSLRAAAVALVLAGACKDEAPARAPSVPAVPTATAPTLRDLALATALDARLARLSLAGSDVEAALGGGSREGANRLLPALRVAQAEVEQAVAAIAHPADRALAVEAGRLASAYAGRLASAVASGAAPAAGELETARGAFGEAIVAYRRSRGAWRVAPAGPDGVEREFDEARRDMERAESGLMSRTRVAPRDEGHELDPAALRMTWQMAVQRATAAASRLPPATKEPALRYAATQEKVLAAVAALSHAPDRERASAARAYHAAKADALGALADYLAAVAAR